MSNATRDLKKNLDDTREAALRSADSALEVASETAATVRDTAASVRDTAAERVAGVRDALSETGDRLAETLRKAAENADVNVLKDSIAAAVGTGVAATAAALNDRSIGDLVRDVQDAARRHPGLFIAGAAIAGFALARILSAPAERQR